MNWRSLAWILAVFASDFALTGCNQQPRNPEIGRYQIAAKPSGGVYVLDTTDGSVQWWDDGSIQSCRRINGFTQCSP